MIREVFVFTDQIEFSLSLDPFLVGYNPSPLIDS